MKSQMVIQNNQGHRVNQQGSRFEVVSNIIHAMKLHNWKKTNGYLIGFLGETLWRIYVSENGAVGQSGNEEHGVFN